MHIPVIFHNLSGYNSHIIMKGIEAMECPDDIEPIPYNMKKYMAFKLRSLRFLDSMQFMKSSLDKLASNLGAENCKEITRKDGTKLPCTKPGHLWHIDSCRCFANPENFKITSKHVPPELLEIYLKKGVYPYEYMNSWEKFFKTQLPQRKHSLVSLITLTYQIRSMSTLNMSGRKLNAKPCGITMTSISRLMYFF